MRVGANTGKGKFGHVGLGHDHRAPRAQPAQRRRVGRGRRRVGKHLRPRARRLTSDIEQVFDGDDGTIERTEVCADTRPRIRRVGCGAGGLGIHGETRAGNPRRSGRRCEQAPLPAGPARNGSAARRSWAPVPAPAQRRAGQRTPWPHPRNARIDDEPSSFFPPRGAFLVDAGRRRGRCQKSGLRHVLPPAALAMKLHNFPPRVLRLSAVPAGAIGTVPLSAACDHEAKYESRGYTKIIRPSDS